MATESERGDSAEITYTYDAAGNRTGKEVFKPGATGSMTFESSYTYNEFNQLTGSVEESREDYIRTAYTYDTNGNQISKTTTDAYTNTQTGQTVYNYDAANRLKTATGTTGGAVDYVQENKYNGFGQRVEKKEGSDVTEYFYDGSAVLYTKDGTGAVTSFNLIGAEDNILSTSRKDQDTYRESRSRTGTLNYYAYCAGNPVSYTDPSGHWAWAVAGAAMGAYDGYKYAKKKNLKGWKKAAAIAGGAVLGAVNPFKVVKAVSKVYKASKYTKSAISAKKATTATKKVVSKPKQTVVVKKSTQNKIRASAVKQEGKQVKRIQKRVDNVGCFTAGTKIHTKDGFKNIEAIKAGDYVWSENPETHEKALKQVKKIFVREKDSIIRLAINGEIIETTHEHPFYVEGRGFIAAVELKAGDEVRLESGEEAFVESTEEIQLSEPVKVYNFEVEDFHTYYVSEQKVLVHNTCARTTKNVSVHTGKSGQAYVIGAYKDVKGIEGMDAHHVGQKAIMETLVENYNYKTAPAISVPVVGHRLSSERGIVSRSTAKNLTARQLLARDIKELRRVYPDIPNSALNKLIELNKKTYTEMRK